MVWSLWDDPRYVERFGDPRPARGISTGSPSTGTPSTGTTLPPSAELTPSAQQTITGIDPSSLAAVLYGHDIPVFVGGTALMAARICEGPFLTDVDGDPTLDANGSPLVSYISSLAEAANPTGTRTISEILLHGKRAWTSAAGSLIPGAEFEVRTGTETQLPFDSSIARFGDSASAYRPHILVECRSIPVSLFAGFVPTASALILDSSFGDPLEGITRNDALEVLALRARLDASEFEFDVSGRDLAWIVAEKNDFLEQLREFQKLFFYWNITTTDKLRVTENGEFDLDATITRENTVSKSIRFMKDAPINLPREMNFKFIDIERDYEPNVATIRLERFPVAATDSIESETIELPVVENASEAMADVAFALFSREVSRKSLNCVGMPFELLGVEAGDSVLFEDDPDITFRGRITEKVHNHSDWTTRIRASEMLQCAFPAVDDAEDIAGQHSIEFYFAADAFVGGGGWQEIIGQANAVADSAWNMRLYDKNLTWFYGGGALGIAVIDVDTGMSADTLYYVGLHLGGDGFIRLFFGTSAGATMLQKAAAPIYSALAQRTLLDVTFEGTSGQTTATDDGPVHRPLLFVGNAEIKTDLAACPTGAVYFDGTGDCVEIPDSNAWNFYGYNSSKVVRIGGRSEPFANDFFTGWFRRVKITKGLAVIQSDTAYVPTLQP